MHLPTPRARRRSTAFGRRLSALRLRIGGLAELRRTVGLPADADLTPRQWAVVEGALASLEKRLQDRLKAAVALSLPRVADGRALNARLGEIELETARAYDTFDTYVDLLTQRSSPRLGRVLAGCDVIARSALSADHPALAMIEPPLVYCDRGFAASILREGVPTPHGGANPLPLIQIPYSRLVEKYNLTSIVHEAGHEAMVRLGLVTALPEALRAALEHRGAPRALVELFCLWTREIGPDFWAFCLTGAAQAAGLRDVLSLPPSQVLRLSWTDPHPPPYLRTLLALRWCRHAWGAGEWDAWEAEWLHFYPLRLAPPAARAILIHGARLLPWVAEALFTTRFRTLGGRIIPRLLDPDAVSPKRLRWAPAATLAPTARLAAFRLAREDGTIGDAEIDGAMTRWLEGLAASRGEPAASRRSVPRPLAESRLHPSIPGR